MDYFQYYKMLLEYSENYSTYDDRIELKVIHPMAVTTAMKRIANSLGFDERMKELSVIVSVFHDLGRFEQIKRYGTYSDYKSIDHADFSAQMLSRTNFMSHLSEQDKNMVLVAIKNHNKLFIEPGITGDALTLCKMIRDADKSDIYRVFVKDGPESTFGGTAISLADDVINPEGYDCIFKHQCLTGPMRKSPIDVLVGSLAFVFDMNYSETFKIMRENKYYRYWFDNTVFNNPQTQKQVDEILAEIEKYIDERIASD